MCMFFFFNDTATTEIYTLSLHDALPIWGGGRRSPGDRVCADGLPSVAPLGMAAARHHRCAVARAAAALHACDHTDDQWRPSLGEPRCPDAAAVRAGQVRGGRLVRNARREERRSTSQLSARRTACV